MKISISKILIFITFVFIVAGGVAQDLLNENQVIGCIWNAIFLFMVSIILFINGAYPFRNRINEDRNIKLSYYFAILCLVLSALEIPLWVLLSGEFPPNDFSETQAVIVVVAVSLSMFGPASPWLLQFRRYLLETNRKMREMKKNKQIER